MSFFKPHILCVDDDEDSCELLRLALGNADCNYQITTVPTPEEALVLAAGQSFDLYVIDYRFPNMTGVELCSRLRKSDGQIPIVFFTAMARPEDRDVAMAAGANAYLVKPVDFVKLTEMVKGLLINPQVHQAKSSTYKPADGTHLKILW